MDFSAIRKEIFNNNLSVNELVTDFFSKIDSIDPEINSFTCVTKDLAEIQAKKIDLLIQKGEKLPPLAGNRPAGSSDAQALSPA